MINETVPVYLLDMYGTSILTNFAIGLFLSLGLGKILPSEDYNPVLLDSHTNDLARIANYNDNYWRVIYVLPAFLNALMLFNFIFFIHEEPIMFSLQEGNDTSALSLINKIYHKDENKDDILLNLKQQMQKKRES